MCSISITFAVVPTRLITCIINVASIAHAMIGVVTMVAPDAAVAIVD